MQTKSSSDHRKAFLVLGSCVLIVMLICLGVTCLGGNAFVAAWPTMVALATLSPMPTATPLPTQTPTPSPTLFPLPARTIPLVRAWNKQVKSICLDAKLNFPKPSTMDKTVSDVASGLGLEVRSMGSPCEATMILQVDGKALAASYSGRGSSYTTLYTGWSITGQVTMDMPGQESLKLPMHYVSVPPDKISLDQYDKGPTEPEDVNFESVWAKPLLNFLEQIWGPRVYVWAMGEDNATYVASLQQLQTLGPQNDILTDLMHAVRSPNYYQRERALYALTYFGPAVKPAMPLLIESLEDQSVSVRADAAEALGNIGPEAKSAVPALEKALEQEKDDLWRYHFSNALKKITGKEYK